MPDFPRVTFRPLVIDGYRTGALDIRLKRRRILSVPTQLGCRVGCSFCISNSSPVVRNLTADEIRAMVRRCFDDDAPDSTPIELSFTGEGEALLNWKETEAVCRTLPRISPDFRSVRYCFSGIGADKLLSKIDGGGFPTRIQFSLHGARQEVRDRLVPRSMPLAAIERLLDEVQKRFVGIELNVVLQDGVNDSDADLAALAQWGSSEWPILINPLLTDGVEVAAARSGYFHHALLAAGREVKRYSNIGAQISRSAIYPLMTRAQLAVAPARAANEQLVELV